jgi:hypothetical protein
MTTCIGRAELNFDCLTRYGLFDGIILADAKHFGHENCTVFGEIPMWSHSQHQPLLALHLGSGYALRAAPFDSTNFSHNRVSLFHHPFLPKA